MGVVWECHEDCKGKSISCQYGIKYATILAIFWD